MFWKKYIIRTNTDDCDMVCAALMDYGITDVQIENNVQLTDEELNRMYADFVKELPEDDGACAVVFYLDENGYIPEGIGTGDSPTPANAMEGFEGVHVEMDEVRQGLAEASELFGIMPVTIEESTVDPQDWTDKWKENFRPFRVGNIIIKPTWEEVPEELLHNRSESAADGSEILPDFKNTQEHNECLNTAPAMNRIQPAVIDIDPGMAFGTGRHETTRLCLEGLQKYMKPGDRVLDLGCGSGILGIAALKLGASYVTAVDIDPEAVRIAGENFELNMGAGGSDSAENKSYTNYSVYTANVLQDDEALEKLSLEKYDVVLANILAEVIVPLAQKVDRLMKENGVFISSGIIDYKLQEVEASVKSNPHLAFLSADEDGEWRCVIACRK